MTLVPQILDLVDRIDDDLDGVIGEYVELAEAVQYLKEKLQTAALARCEFDNDGYADHPTAVIQRNWQSSKERWDWPLMDAAVAGLIAREHDIPEEQALAIISEHTDCIGGTKSKAWRKGSMKDREIWSKEMSWKEDGKWTVSLRLKQ